MGVHMRQCTYSGSNRDGRILCNGRRSKGVTLRVGSSTMVDDRKHIVFSVHVFRTVPTAIYEGIKLIG